MTANAKPQTSREKVKNYRQRMRDQGMRLVQMWVPDVDSPEFKAEARRQSLIIARSAHAAEDQAFIDSISVGIWDEI